MTQPRLELTPQHRGILEWAAIKAGISAEAFLDRVIDQVSKVYIETPEAMGVVCKGLQEDAEQIKPA